MKKTEYRTRRLFKDAKRLIDLRDVSYHIGNILCRRSLRYTTLAALIASGGYFSKYIGMSGISGRQALAVPLIMGAVTLGGGLALKYIPSMISSGLMNIASANNLPLMEDLKKSKSEEHLETLWDRIYHYEAELRYTKKERREAENHFLKESMKIKSCLEKFDGESTKFLGIQTPECLESMVKAVMIEKPATNHIARIKEEFMISSQYVLLHHQSQAEQREQIGFCLSLLENWYNGAYFNQGDNRLAEQYSGEAMLSGAKWDLGWGKLRAIREAPEKLYQKIWFNVITRNIAINVGNAVNSLNRKYKKGEFDAQLFLWPGEEERDWLDDCPGALELVLEKRKSIIKRAFGEDYEDALVMLDRMFLPSFKLATELRMKYDPEYINGALDYNLVDDLHQEGCSDEYIEEQRRWSTLANINLAEFVDYLKKTRTYLFDFGMAEELRAIKIAFHVNKKGLKEIFGNNGGCDFIDQRINKAARKKERYSNRLLAVRQHHQIAIFELETYRNLVKELAYQS